MRQAQASLRGPVSGACAAASNNPPNADNTIHAAAAWPDKDSSCPATSAKAVPPTTVAPKPNAPATVVAPNQAVPKRGSARKVSAWNSATVQAEAGIAAWGWRRSPLRAPPMGSTAPPAKASGEANAPLLRSPACGQSTQVPRILIPGRSGRLWPGEGYALLLGARFRRVLKF